MAEATTPTAVATEARAAATIPTAVAAAAMARAESPGLIRNGQEKNEGVYMKTGQLHREDANEASLSKRKSRRGLT